MLTPEQSEGTEAPTPHPDVGKTAAEGPVQAPPPAGQEQQTSGLLEPGFASLPSSRSTKDARHLGGL
ncbi:hypothetical protein MC885_001223, partial [Smutsia gigantea]